MIEVEKRYQWPTDNTFFDFLEKEAVFVKNKKNNDIYYDTPEVDIMQKDWYLRTRNNIWELKKGIPETTEFYYEEIQDHNRIKELLTAPLDSNLDTWVKENFVFQLPVITQRKSYIYNNLRIDVDQTTYGPEYPELSLNMIDLEIITKDTNQIKEAENTIKDFARQFNLIELGSDVWKLSLLINHINPELEARIPK